MRNSFGLVDKNPEDRMLAAAFELELNKLISLALNDLLYQETDSIPFDALAHTNKKVGRNAHSKTRTTPEYRCRLRLKQPAFPYVCLRMPRYRGILVILNVKSG